MNPHPGNSWSNHHPVGHEPSTDDFEFNQRDKPMKAVIGVGLLIAFALLLSQMNPAPHDNASTDPAPTSQTTGSNTR